MKVRTQLLSDFCMVVVGCSEIGESRQFTLYLFIKQGEIQFVLFYETGLGISFFSWILQC